MAILLEIANNTVLPILLGVLLIASFIYRRILESPKHSLEIEKEIRTPLADQYLKDGFAYVNINGDRIRVPSLSKEEEEIGVALEEPKVEVTIPMDKTISQVAYDYASDRIFWASDDGEMGNFKLQTQRTYCTTGAVVQNFISDDDQLLTEGQLKKIFERDGQSEIDWVNRQKDAIEVSRFFFQNKDEFDRELVLIPSVKDRYIAIQKKMEKRIGA